MDSDTTNSEDNVTIVDFLNSSDDDEEANIFVQLLMSLTNRLNRQPRHNSALTGREYALEQLYGHPENMFEICCMHRDTFEAIVRLIQDRNLLPSLSISTEESLMMFLRTIALSDRNREIQDRFVHSGETVHRYFVNVLTALSALAPDVIKPPNMNIVPPKIRYNPKY
ncbi:uncharacterized protein LOC112091698 [Morus notabilis]|uniref:uncharacterized protein LOC112091698 n=1 Tax=Morus notabilis TaxID=981085 RepID=UPI000CED7997|nr:uncharacterized protein LOC112091698 [Morus notabilis]